MAAAQLPGQPPQPQQPKMPGMVSTMASGQAQQTMAPWQPKTAEDIYRMSDADRTKYYQDVRNNFSQGDYGGNVNFLGNTIGKYRANPEFQKWFDSQGADIQGDFNGGYITPEQRALKLQQINTQNFRNSMPMMQQQMTSQLQNQASNSLQAGLKQTDQANNERGLLYSGINEGQKAGLRAKTQAAVAQGIGGINSDLENSAEQIESNTVGSGLTAQQTQQQLYNQTYQQAMARMNAQNAEAGSAMGLLASAAMIALL